MRANGKRREGVRFSRGSARQTLLNKGRLFPIILTHSVIHPRASRLYPDTAHVTPCLAMDLRQPSSSSPSSSPFPSAQVPPDHNPHHPDADENNSTQPIPSQLFHDFLNDDPPHFDIYGATQDDQRDDNQRDDDFDASTQLPLSLM
ncbi:hypothetical protein SMACR_09931 [Sordaria macrospora]|nr:hypothetical protein SMACR_09931 [Sordaria macrospora]WPJ64064.1 hypothetical protein SMAC4_09931 [Sordaria macrospora]